MINPKEFYTSEKSKYQAELDTLKKQLNLSSSIRLLLFLAIIVLIYFFYTDIQILTIILLLGIGVFLFLISRHTQLQKRRHFNQELLNINEKELKVLNRDFYAYEDGAKYDNPLHFYSYDIDLFGKGSFFQYVNRTVTEEGELEFAKQLMSNDFSDVRRRQDAIRELAQLPHWRQEFYAIGKMVKVQYPADRITQWIDTYTSVLPKATRLLPMIFGFVSLALIVLLVLDVVPYIYLLGWVGIGLGISRLFAKKTGAIYNQASKAKDTFSQYHKLLNKIEQETFEAEILKEKQNAIQTKDEKASTIFSKFSKILDSFDQRNNMIVALLGNGLFLWDLLFANKVETWIERYDEKIDNWFEVISFFDAINTSANFSFNHPTYVYPKINHDKNIIQAEKLGHPLLKTTNRVDNDFLIQDQQFFIITGANMAGKSTFLRTVSLSIVMANMGLPVCAKSFDYSPIKLITSMRTSDSLVDDESYFFSELKRLKFIVDEIKSEKYFIILDEILKGTNSTDKAIGSKKFVEKLVASNSTGIIATHDLSLCSIENEFDEVENYYFDAEIVDDELFFDYRLKHGICQNMNASFLLKKMEIV